LARDLYPPALEHSTLAGALQELVAARTDGTEAELTLDCDDTIELPLPSMVSLYRVAQEAVHNAGRHSGSPVITIHLRRDASGVTLSIGDNGSGFNMSESMVGGFGLRSMRERMALVGGSLLLVSSPEQGTLVTARIP
jgi:NarL family two-component system sensor histidine kinase LiaS